MTRSNAFKYSIQFNFILAVLVYAAPSHAYYPSTLWSSERINESLTGVRVGDVMGEGRQDIVAIGLRRLMIFRIIENQPFKIIDQPGKRSEEWIKLSLFDLDEDRTDEILISGFRNGHVFSIVGKIKNGQFVRVREVDYFLTVVPWAAHDFPSPLVGEGRPALSEPVLSPVEGVEGERGVVFGQKSVGGESAAGPLFELTWNGNDFVQKGTIKLPGGLSGKSLSLYSLSGIELGDGDQSFLHISESGNIILYRIEHGKYRKKWSSGENYGGTVFQIDRNVKSPLGIGGTDDFKVPISFQVSSPLPRLSAEALAKEEGERVGERVASPTIFIPKNAGYLGGVLGANPSVKNSQMVRLVWSGYGFQEEWNSPRLDGAISDFCLYDWDGDGKKEIVVSFLLREGGYGDTLKRQDSLIIVLRTE